MNIEAAAN